MPGGVSPADAPDDDRQCIHCGRCYAEAGIIKHERYCEWSGSPRRMYPLSDPLARLRADDVDTTTGRDDGVEHDPDDDPGDDPPDEPSSETVPADTVAATDGGPNAVPSFDAPETTTTDDPDSGCPECGSHDYFIIDALPDDVTERTPSLQKYDRACRPCSTDENDHLSTPIQAYNP